MMLRTRISTLLCTLSLMAVAVGSACGDDNDLRSDGASSSAALRGGSNENENERITICHATGSETNPYVEITIAESAVEAHRDHQDLEDIIPAPAGGCPGPAEGEGEGECPKCECECDKCHDDDKDSDSDSDSDKDHDSDSDKDHDSDSDSDSEEKKDHEDEKDHGDLE